MASKKIYICEKTQNQVEISWETGLINFHISQPDGTYLADLSFNRFDMYDMDEDIDCYIDAIIEEEKESKKLTTNNL